MDSPETKKQKEKKKSQEFGWYAFYYKISNADDKIRMSGFGFRLLKSKYFGMLKKKGVTFTTFYNIFTINFKW